MIMRIDKIDNRTNFKMALKISPKLHPDIVKKGNPFKDFLDNYGSSISDVKLYNVVFDNNIEMPRIFHHDSKITRDFFIELKGEEKNLGKWYDIPSGMPGESNGGFFPDEPRIFQRLYGKEAKKKYAEFKKMNIYEQAAEYSRMLEEYDVKRMVAQEREKSAKAFREAEEKEKLEKLNHAVDDIIEKYKYEEPKPDTNASKEKKNWWQKIFG